MDDIVFEIIIVATVLWGLNSGSTDAMHFSYGFRSSKVVVTSIWIWHNRIIMGNQIYSDAVHLIADQWSDSVSLVLRSDLDMDPQYGKNHQCGTADPRHRFSETRIWYRQGCRSAFIFCGSGSSSLKNADPDPA